MCQQQDWSMSLASSAMYCFVCVWRAVGYIITVGSQAIWWCETRGERADEV